MKKSIFANISSFVQPALFSPTSSFVFAFLFVLTFLIALSTQANDLIISDCKFRAINATAQISVNPVLEKINGQFERAIRSVLIVNKAQVRPYTQICGIGAVNKTICHHQGLGVRYVVYPQINDITGKAGKISMIKWEGQTPVVYYGTCK